jgi:hypothetical protein
MQELDYVEVRTTEQRDKHTRGECVSSTKREKAVTLQSMPTYEGWKCRDSTKYAPERMYKGSCRGSTKYTTRTK